MGIAVGVLLILKKSFTIALKDIALLVLWLFLFLCIIHLITTTKLSIESYGKYIAATYARKITAGGIIFSLFTYPLLGLTHSFVSTIILFVIGLVVDSTFIVTRFYDYYQLKNKNTISEEDSYDDFDIESIKSVNTTPQFDDSIFIEDEEVEQLEKENKVTELTTTEKDKIKAKKILGLNKDPDLLDEKIEPSGELNKLKDVLLNIPKREKIQKSSINITKNERALTLNQAVYSLTETIDIDSALGKIYGEFNLPCPPAVPIIMPGEVISKNTIDIFKYYKVDKIKIINKR